MEVEVRKHLEWWAAGKVQSKVKRTLDVDFKCCAQLNRHWLSELLQETFDMFIRHTKQLNACIHVNLDCISLTKLYPSIFQFIRLPCTLGPWPWTMIFSLRNRQTGNVIAIATVTVTAIVEIATATAADKVGMEI